MNSDENGKTKLTQLPENKKGCHWQPSLKRTYLLLGKKKS